MEYSIDELNTLEAIRIANDLGNIEVNEPFVLKTDLKFVRPFGMLVCITAIKQLRDRYKDVPFSFSVDQNKQGFSYACNAGFFKSISDKICIGKMPGEANGNDNYIPITELDLHQIHQNEIEAGNHVHMGDAVEKESLRLAKVLSRGNNELCVLMTYLIREMLRNIPEHSESNKALICGQYWADNTAEIAIVDEGIGIKRSLQKNSKHREYIKSDEDALLWSIKAGISQAFQPSQKNKEDDIWSNSGFGLYMVSQICKELNGSFGLASGKKYISIDNSGTINVKDTHFMGTAVEIKISTNDIGNCKKLISKIANRGETEAKTIRNAFKKASTPSKGLLNNS